VRHMRAIAPAGHRRSGYGIRGQPAGKRGGHKAYEASDLYQKEFAPALQPFFDGEYKTYRSEVKYMQ